MCPGELGDIELEQILCTVLKNQECRVGPSSPALASPWDALCSLSHLLHLPGQFPWDSPSATLSLYYFLPGSQTPIMG